MLTSRLEHHMPIDYWQLNDYATAVLCLEAKWMHTPVLGHSKSIHNYKLNDNTIARAPQAQ